MSRKICDFCRLAREKRFSLVDVITGEDSTRKQYIDVTRIRDITEYDHRYGYKTTYIVFDNGVQPVHLRGSIEVAFDKLKKAEVI